MGGAGGAPRRTCRATMQTGCVGDTFVPVELSTSDDDCYVFLDDVCDTVIQVKLDGDTEPQTWKIDTKGCYTSPDVYFEDGAQ